ncbi:class I adenylate-forming enzyme family protein [Polymorphobacter fuscus]|uniref:AMP-binding protein n=1 Tax=Sandarakinorhabdus fusca TaxID=1439888 RepID=A0A7C9GNK9_9SPHN|nr:class I adenylate-forming enzyme family protein [Polymorphobacter fuscus]KAB7647569.1 acyl--CoA ligase [Polymorphobacter fuscus]MQT16835.1 AMP-binding protein [Polymorphobacter fuscus]NJC09176.1 long-chain acyl-CoA synthetase [Polymorphobacter fuscus]
MTVPDTFPAMSIAQANALLTASGSLLEMETVTIRGRPTRTWKHAPPTLRDVFLAGRAHGDKVFLVLEEERVTFEGFARAALRLAAQLIADGVQKGDRVAIVMRNLPEWPVAFFGATLTGAIVTPLNAWWTGAELEYGLSDSGTKVVICDNERLARLASHLPDLPELQRIYVTRATEEPQGDPREVWLESIIGRPNSWGSIADRALPDIDLAPEDDATIFYTSGTTGRPKGALGTHRNIVSNIMASGFAATRAYLRRGVAPPVPDPQAAQKATLLSVPFFHATGCHAVLTPSLFGGAKLVLMRKWDVLEAMALIEKERVTGCGGVPTIAWQIIEHPERARFDLSSLETVSYGGAPSAPELVRQIKKVFPKAMPGNGWGMTETSATFTSHVGEDYELRPESCGPACAVCDLQVRDPDGNVLPPGTVGELYGFGPNVVKGYWNKPEATAATFIDGWVRTGDLARVDEEGFCFIIDRAKDMLIRGGENIYCVEVENALYEHPAIMDAALVGRPHRTLGEEPVAFVTLKAGMSANEDELRSFVAARLAAFKVPVAVTFSHEPLVRNANGKILKTELKKLMGV